MSAKNDEYSFTEVDRSFICGVLINVATADGWDQIDWHIKTAIRRAVIGLAKEDDLLFEEVKRSLPPDSEWHTLPEDVESGLTKTMTEGDPHESV